MLLTRGSSRQPCEVLNESPTSALVRGVLRRIPRQASPGTLREYVEAC